MADIQFALIGSVDGDSPFWLVYLPPGGKPGVIEVPKKTIAPLLALHFNSGGNALRRNEFRNRKVPFAKKVLKLVKNGNSLSSGAAVAITGDKLASLDALRVDFVEFEDTKLGDVLHKCGIFEDS